MIVLCPIYPVGKAKNVTITLNALRGTEMPYELEKRGFCKKINLVGIVLLAYFNFLNTAVEKYLISLLLFEHCH